MKSTSYSNYVVTIRNLPSIGMEVFRADSSNYPVRIQELRTRQGGEPIQLYELCVLVECMFEARVVETCTISFGTKLTFKLMEQDERGRKLLLDVALQRFRAAFVGITGRGIEVVWEDTSGMKVSEPSDGGRDVGGLGEAFARGLGEVVDTVPTVLLFKWLDD